MALVAPLIVFLMMICRNGVLPGVKLVQAIKAVQREKAIFLTREINVDDLCGKLARRLRMLAAKFRDVKMNEDSYQKCMGKAWGFCTHKEINSAT